jgi:uncharacterized NAD(P)/FAD-binding protein YdhS
MICAFGRWILAREIPCDLAIVGGGLSGSLVLIQLVEHMRKHGISGSEPARMLLFDRLGAFGCGIPYGELHAQPGFLLIEPAAESTAPEFQDWLISNRNTLLCELSSSQDPALNAWVQENGAEFARGHIGDLFIPRRLFGKFIGTRLRAAIDVAGAERLAKIELLHEEVLTLDICASRGFRLGTANGSAHATTTVLAVGCVPRSACADLNVTEGYVHDVWDQGYAGVTAAICGRAKEFGRQLDLLIIGSGASAGEVIYFLKHSPQLLTKLRSIRVVSRSGYLAGGGAGAAAGGPPLAGAWALKRRSAREYTAAARALADSGLLSPLAAIISAPPRCTPDKRLELLSESGMSANLFADVVINCMGTGELDTTSSPLLAGMTRSEPGFRINHLGIGFQLRAGSAETADAEGCFVIGPLQNEETIDTHVESIHGVYRSANSLVPRLFARLNIP